MFILRGKTLTFAALLFVAAFAAVIVLTYALCSNFSDIDFSAKFYYVCYSCPSDAVSASSVSSLVYSCGGAGYTIESGGNYYAVVSCYYEKADAESVIYKLEAEGIKCGVLEISAQGYRIKGSKADAKECENVMNTMLSLSKVCYNLANSLDKFDCDDKSARLVICDVRDLAEELNGVSACFYDDLTDITEFCDEIMSGYINSRDVRNLQIQFCDALANATFE